MKKTLITLAVLAGSIASVQATTVYDKDGTTLSVGGRAEVRGLFADSVDGSMQDKSRARINVGGETKISENLTGFGFVEYELTGSDSIKNRYIYAGIGTQAGDFSYGKQDTANVIVSDMTDIASYHSGQQQYIGSSSDKQDNVFLYSADFFDSLTVQANYIAQEEKDLDAYALSALFSMDFGLDLAASYSDQDEENQVTLGAAYTLNDLYLGATYAMGTKELKDNDFTSVELTAQYKFDNGLRFIGMYGLADEDIAGDTEDFFALEAQYRFNSNIRTYISYKLNNLDKDEVGAAKAEDEVVVGLRFNF